MRRGQQPAAGVLTLVDGVSRGGHAEATALPVLVLALAAAGI
jgi:hypothetical protein